MNKMLNRIFPMQLPMAFRNGNGNGAASLKNICSSQFIFRSLIIINAFACSRFDRYTYILMSHVNECDAMHRTNSIIEKQSIEKLEGQDTKEETNRF